MRVHMPSKDEEKIVEYKEKLSSQLSKVVSYEEEQQSLIKDLAKTMDKTAKEKSKLAEIQGDLIEKLKIASRNPAAQIDDSEIQSLRNSRDTLEKSLTNQRHLADAFYELSNVMNSFLDKKDDYQDAMGDLVKFINKWQDYSYKLMKARNKYKSEKKQRKYEEKISELDGKIIRGQRQIDRQMETLIEEAKLLDQAWNNVRSSIRKYGW